MEDDDEEDKDKPIGIEKKEETKHKVQKKEPKEKVVEPAPVKKDYGPPE